MKVTCAKLIMTRVAIRKQTSLWLDAVDKNDSGALACQVNRINEVRIVSFGLRLLKSLWGLLWQQFVRLLAWG